MKIWPTLYSINGAANSNNKDIPPTHKEWAKSSIIKCRWGSGGKRTLAFVALGLQNDTFDTVYLLTELKHLFRVLLNNWPPWFLPICRCLYPYKNLHKCIYKCFIYNYKDSESIKFFFRRWRDKCSVIYWVNTEPLDAERKWTIKSWKGLEETYRHISRWNKLIWKPLLLGKHMTYNMILILYKRQIYRDIKICDHRGFGMKRVKKKRQGRDFQAHLVST